MTRRGRRPGKPSLQWYRLCTNLAEILCSNVPLARETASFCLRHNRGVAKVPDRARPTTLEAIVQTSRLRRR